jgi:glyoxylase I family protein
MIIIFVSDLQEARRFYSDILGFEIGLQSEDRLELTHSLCDFVVFKCDRDAEVEDYSRTARSAFAFEVDDIDESFEQLRAKGVKLLHEAPTENDLFRYAAFCDPFGNVHELFERK